MPEQQQVRKRKQPPTFQHYPAEQAKKLKKAWIEKTQIKSKWRIEKRKLQAEGILATSVKPWEVRDNGYQQRPGHDKPNSSHEDDDAHSESEQSESAPPPKRSKHDTMPHADLDPPPHRNRPSSSEGSPKKTRPVRPLKPSANKSGKPSWNEHIKNTIEQTKGKSKAKPGDVDESDDPVSLRDLKREAYSKTVLHNFKADPLQKHRHTTSQLTGRERGAGRGRTGPGRDTGGGPGRGKSGQPNMKLRMDYMLEKIKRDYVSNPST